jgi:adenylate cyclase
VARPPAERPPPDGARAVGRRTVDSWRRNLAQRVADLLQRDPDRLAQAIELGLIRREWLEHPGDAPMTTATPVEVVERYLQGSVERRPSLLASLGLTALQVLASEAEDEPGEGTTETLAVAFTDLEGFTAFTESVGDAAASRLLAEHHRVVGPIVRGRGGRVAKRLGDGLLLTFPEPEAAVLACLELVAAHPEPLRLRAGVHMGDVVLTRDDVVGHVVNVAARVTESARGGEVRVTSQVRAAAREVPSVRFSRSRRRTYKGIGDAVLVCRAEWLSP